MNENLKHFIYFVITVFGITVLPFIILSYNDGLKNIHFDTVFDIIYEQTFGTMRKNMDKFLAILIPTLILVPLTTTLLFGVKIDEKKEVTIKKTWYWKYFLKFFANRKRKVWHVLLGYYLAILTLLPATVDPVGTIQHIGNYPSLIISIIFLTPILVIARALSKLELQVIDTNFGVFIILVYFSEIFLSVISGSYVPLETFRDFVDLSTNNVQSIFMAYGTLTTMVFIATIADIIIVKGVLRKPL